MTFGHHHFNQVTVITKRKFLVTGQTVFLIRPAIQSMTHSIVQGMDLLIQIITLMTVLAI
jgi:hypothetical protein